MYAVEYVYECTYMRLHYCEYINVYVFVAYINIDIKFIIVCVQISKYE